MNKQMEMAESHIWMGFTFKVYRTSSTRPKDYAYQIIYPESGIYKNREVRGYTLRGETQAKNLARNRIARLYTPYWDDMEAQM